MLPQEVDLRDVSVLLRNLVVQSFSIDGLWNGADEEQLSAALERLVSRDRFGSLDPYVIAAAAPAIASYTVVGIARAIEELVHIERILGYYDGMDKRIVA